MEHVRSMLSTAKFAKSFWAEAMNTACYLVNWSPIITLELKTPEEVWSDKPAVYSFLRVFSCDAYIWVPKEKRTKLDMNFKRCIFLGYAIGTKGYRLWDPTAHKIIINYDIVFYEIFFMAQSKSRKAGIFQLSTLLKKIMSRLMVSLMRRR